VALPALAAERRAAVQRYLLPAGLTAANPQRRQASDLTDWQTDARPLHSLMYTADWWCLRRVSDALIAHQTSLVEHITCPVVNYTAAAAAAATCSHPGRLTDGCRRVAAIISQCYDWLAD